MEALAVAGRRCYGRAMKRWRLLGAAILVASAFLAVAIPSVSAKKTHAYEVHLSIYVDRAEHKIKGMVSYEGPSFFCEESNIRLVKVAPGKDEKVSEVKPGMFGKWGFRTTSRLSGSRVYAEVLKYHLPQRPVICLGARSRTVTAP
jgi:hypothetical protein